MNPFTWLNDRCSALARNEPLEYRDSLISDTPCGEPDRCSSYWIDVAIAAQEDADRYAAQLVRLGAKPEPRRDGFQVGTVAP